MTNDGAFEKVKTIISQSLTKDFFGSITSYRRFKRDKVIKIINILIY